MIDIEAFYETHIDKIFNFCLYRTCNRFVAEDLTSETFLKFFKAKDKRMDNPVAYLYSVCRHVIADHYRSYKEAVSLETLLAQGADFGVSIDEDKKLMFEQVLKHVGSLPVDQKEVILMQYVQDLDNKTIALALNKTESAIKSLAHRGLETLRSKLNK